MPTPRRGGSGPASKSSPSRLRDSSSSSHPNHHQTADELALQEAEEILESDDEDPNSPRALRYAELTRKREHTAESDQDPAPNGVGGTSEPNDDDGSDAESDVDDAENSSSDDSSASSSGSDSESASDSDDCSASSDSDDDGEEELERCLVAARKAAAAKEAKANSKAPVPSAEDDGELRFEEEVKEAPIPDLDIPALPAPVLTLNVDGTASTSRPAGASRKGKALELDSREYERPLSKREKAAQPKKASVSEQWATIPAPRADDLPKMKRDYQALSLANSLDPKRFMKGQGKLGRVPERFNIGTMIEAPRHLQDTTVRKERTYRAGQIVSSVVNDMEVESYAKRKYEELQSKRMHNGRGKGWQKRAKW